MTDRKDNPNRDSASCSSKGVFVVPLVCPPHLSSSPLLSFTLNSSFGLSLFFFSVFSEFFIPSCFVSFSCDCFLLSFVFFPDLPFSFVFFCSLSFFLMFPPVFQHYLLLFDSMDAFFSSDVPRLFASLPPLTNPEEDEQFLLWRGCMEDYSWSSAQLAFDTEELKTYFLLRTRLVPQCIEQVLGHLWQRGEIMTVVSFVPSLSLSSLSSSTSTQSIAGAALGAVVGTVSSVYSWMFTDRTNPQPPRGRVFFRKLLQVLPDDATLSFFFRVPLFATHSETERASSCPWTFVSFFVLLSFCGMLSVSFLCLLSLSVTRCLSVCACVCLSVAFCRGSLRLRHFTSLLPSCTSLVLLVLLVFLVLLLFLVLLFLLLLCRFSLLANCLDPG